MMHSYVDTQQWERGKEKPAQSKQKNQHARYEKRILSILPCIDPFIRKLRNNLYIKLHTDMYKLYVDINVLNVSINK